MIYGENKGERERNNLELSQTMSSERLLIPCIQLSYPLFSVKCVTVVSR